MIDTPKPRRRWWRIAAWLMCSISALLLLTLAGAAWWLWGWQWRSELTFHESWSAEERAAPEAYMNEEVEIQLFRDNDKYRDPVFVGCNGETIAIQRGERVKIRRKFAEILENSDKQDYETGLLIRRKSEEFRAANP